MLDDLLAVDYTDVHLGREQRAVVLNELGELGAGDVVRAEDVGDRERELDGVPDVLGGLVDVQQRGKRVQVAVHVTWGGTRTCEMR